MRGKVAAKERAVLQKHGMARNRSAEAMLSIARAQTRGETAMQRSESKSDGFAQVSMATAKRGGAMAKGRIAAALL